MTSVGAVGTQRKSVPLKEGPWKGLMPEPSPEGRGAVNQNSMGRGLGQKEEPGQGRCRAGQGGVFRGMKAVWSAGDASSEK